MAHGHHHHAPAPDPMADVTSPAVAAPAAAPVAPVHKLPAPSMAASLATTPASLVAPASHPDADDAAQGEHVAFHRHQMDTRVLAHLWRHA